MDIAAYNRQAWDGQVEKKNRWTCPVTPEIIAAAREGTWEVVLTPQKPVPMHWFPALTGLRVLCLASGGGQQVPILAAAGADVTVLDNSPKQLEQDALVGEREGLSIKTQLGDMRDLSVFENDAFDLVFNPCSICFVPEVRPVFQEAARVLKTGGSLMCGFTNPIRYIFDETLLDEGEIHVRHKLPYADETHLEPSELDKLKAESEPFLFSHSLEDLISGQIQAGFQLLDLFEDIDDGKLSDYAPTYLGTLAKKL